MQGQDMPDPGRVLGETQQFVLCFLLAMSGGLCSMHELAVAIGDHVEAEVAVAGLHAEGLVHRLDGVRVRDAPGGACARVGRVGRASELLKGHQVNRWPRHGLEPCRGRHGKKRGSSHAGSG